MLKNWKKLFQNMCKENSIENIVSIIVPVYNTSQYLEKCINSISNQTYSNIEIIVIDDGSNQKTKNKIEELSSKIDVVIHQSNKGQSTARNIGLNRAKGHFVIFVDSDDYVSENFCKELIENYNNEFSVVTCYANLFTENKNLYVYKPEGGGLKEAIIKNTALGTSLFVKEELKKIGGYDESMVKGFEDWELLIRLLKNTTKKIKVVETPLYFYRKGIISTTTTANKLKYKLLKYIYTKHINTYINYHEEIVNHLLNNIEKEEHEKNKMYNRIEYKIGFAILKPLRFIKRIFNV